MVYDNSILHHYTQKEKKKRQGDPLSPILFNLALEPLLQTILQDSLLPEVLPHTLYRDSGTPTALKTLASADDVLVVLTRPSEYAILQRHLHIYERASNGKLNTSKTQVLSVTGKPLGPNWLNILASHSITDIFYYRSLIPLTYLGYFIIQSSNQSKYIETLLLEMADKGFDP
ncbi:hypothetical protein INT47_008606 [Mucor saturninus]|uniref:Reverse transcriptase domain-containing protein n=1 Tax=Mucor saturninus TaxID=64648 RepID=A0A8H7UY81_9FUNG|nr:hypothetical protein INT47_008606 [Mucor saturninus]